MVSFQTLFVQPGDFCLYYKGCSKTIGVVLFFSNEATFGIFEMVSFQTALIFFCMIEYFGNTIAKALVL